MKAFTQMLTAAAVAALVAGAGLATEKSGASTPLELETSGDCRMTVEEVDAMPATKVLHAIADTVGTPGTGSPEGRIITLGHVIGQQARHVGDDPARAQWFSCIQERIAISYHAASMMSTGPSNPIPFDRTFQLAIMGMLDDDQLKSANIDPGAEVGSVFDAPWGGSWLVSARAQSAHGFKMRAKLDFDLYSDPPTVTLSGSEGESMTLPATTAGDVVTFEHLVTGTHRYVWTLTYGEEQCTGEIATYGPNRTVMWDILECVPVGNDP
ncbi:MAG: hypothetical protein QNJ20_13225 [Paracoccaceae bacterium]|nr:hypothetical protein [Paracoccaceae bacterium]